MTIADCTDAEGEIRKAAFACLKRIALVRKFDWWGYGSAAWRGEPAGVISS